MDVLTTFGDNSAKTMVDCPHVLLMLSCAVQCVMQCHAQLLLQLITMVYTNILQTVNQQLNLIINLLAPLSVYCSHTRHMDTCLD